MKKQHLRSELFVNGVPHGSSQLKVNSAALNSNNANGGFLFLCCEIFHDEFDPGTALKGGLNWKKTSQHKHKTKFAP